MTKDAKRRVVLAATCSILLGLWLVPGAGRRAVPEDDAPLRIDPEARHRPESEISRVLQVGSSARGLDDAGGGARPDAGHHVDVVDVADGSVAPSGDDSWQSLPRNDQGLRSMADQVLSGHGADPVPLLFRNVWLNESDRHVAEDRRRELRATMVSVISQLRVLGEVRARFIQEQVVQQVALGRVVPTAPAAEPTDEQIEMFVRGTRAQLMSARELAARGVDMGRQIAELELALAAPEKHAVRTVPIRREHVVFENGAGMHHVDLREVEGWSELQELRDHLLDAFVLTAARWFDREGLLSPQRWDVVRRRFLAKSEEDEAGHQGR